MPGIVLLMRRGCPMGNFQRLHDYLESGDFSLLLPKLYGNQYDRDSQVARYSLLIETHRELFGDGKGKNPGLFSTAGRSELAGNHTDHNLGKVIAATINLDTIAVATPIDEPRVTLVSEGFPAVTVDLSDLSVHTGEEGTTDALVRGIARGFVDRGLSIGGFVANTSTRVLKGSGLSSSAAIEILVATLFNNLYNRDTLDPVELAIIGKYAENTYFGKPSGLMDQIACGNGGITGIDFAHPEKPIVTPIECDFQKLGYDLLVVDTGGNHADLTPDYAAIPKEMRAVAACFDCDVLREVPFGLFVDSLVAIRKKVKNDRAILRAFHYLSENDRVDAMLAALQQGQMERFLALVNESGASSFRFLQNLYSTKATDEQRLPLALAMTEQFLEGDGACRVHGGGFAGTIQVYVPTRRTAQYIAYIERVFGAGSATLLAIRSLPTTRLD